VSDYPKYRIVALWNERQGHRLQLRLNREKIGDILPESRENMAELRRMAETHAGFELDWRGMSTNDMHESDMALWIAPAVDKYIPADTAA
jgi:hypothetical protein